MDHPKLIVSNQKKESIRVLSVNDALYYYIPGCRDFQNKCLGVGENITEGCITYQCNHQGDRIGLDAVQAGNTCIHNKL